jgi:hypothetical protein
VGDLLSLSLIPYKRKVLAKCGVETWEELWNQWTNEKEPLSLSGRVADCMRASIRESWERQWTTEALERELVFVGQSLELWIVRCQAVHDRILEKSKTELFVWLQDTKDMVVTGELTFPTANGKEVVFEAIRRQQKYNFKYKQGKWYTKGRNGYEVAYGKFPLSSQV